MENRNPPAFIIYLILAIVGFHTFFPKFFDKSIVRAESFSVRKPKGWKVEKQDHEIIFTAPDADLFTNIPDAVFSIYAQKEKSALFMEDFFPEMLASLARERGRVLSTGTELIDNQQAKWVLFRYDSPEIAVMTLFIIDDYNRLTRIQYMGSLKKFKEYGQVFDEFKRSIKLK